MNDFRQFTALVNVFLKGVMSSGSSHIAGKNKKNRKSRNGMNGFLIFLGAFIAGYSFMYSELFMGSFIKAGRPDMLFIVWSVIAILCPAFIGINGASSFIFGGKDNSILLPAPISPTVLMAAKTMSLYEENLFFTILIMVPAGIVYMMHESVSAAGAVMFIAGIVIMPLFPCIADMVIGAFIAAFGSRSKHKTLVTNAISLAFIVGIMVWGFTRNSDPYQTADIAGITKATGWCVPAVWFSQASAGNSFKAFILFAASAVLIFVLTAYIISRSYMDIISRSSAVSVRHDYRLGHMQKSGQLKAVYNKEIKKIFGTSAYFLNCAMGSVMLLIFAAISASGLGAGKALSEIPAEYAGYAYAGSIIAMLFCIAMSPTTAVSISVEGKNLWILKESPVPVSTIFKAKILANLTITVPSVIAGGILFAFGMKYSPAEFLFFIMIGLICCVMSSIYGLALNLRYPKLDAVNEVYIYKRSASIGFAILISFIMTAAAAGVMFGMMYLFGLYAASSILAALGLLLTFILYVRLRNKGEAVFERL